MELDLPAIAPCNSYTDTKHTHIHAYNDYRIWMKKPSETSELKEKVSLELTIVFKSVCFNNLSMLSKEARASIGQL